MRGADETLSRYSALIDQAIALDNPPGGMGDAQSDLLVPGRLLPQHPIENSDDPAVARQAPQAIYNPGDYGDAAIIPFTTVANTDMVVLQRPKNTRIFMLIQVISGGPLNVAFDSIATVTANCLQIPGGGNLLMDKAVMQNDVHIASSNGPVTGIVSFINTDMKNATT